MDLSGALSAAIDAKLKTAKKHEAAGHREHAAAAYRECATLMDQYASHSALPNLRKQRLDAATGYREKATQLLRPPTVVTTTEPAGGELEDDILQLIHKSSVAWADIGGLENTKDEIKIAYGLQFVQKPSGVSLGGWQSILLYGPPGTGKTLLAAATSNGLQATFFNVQTSSLVSKYFGESSRLITTLYAVARRMASSVIYIDEFEALSGQRGGDDSGAERRIVSTLLAELDGLVGKDTPAYVLTIVGTNLPWLLDKAILSRFQKKIFVPLPDEKARESILRIHLERQGIKSEVTYEEMASLTRGYSGRELERLCKQLTSRIVSELNPDLAGLVDRGVEALERYLLKLRPVLRTDLEGVLDQMKPETTEDDLKKFSDWERGSM